MNSSTFNEKDELSQDEASLAVIDALEKVANKK